MERRGGGRFVNKQTNINSNYVIRRTNTINCFIFKLGFSFVWHFGFRTVLIGLFFFFDWLGYKISKIGNNERSIANTITKLKWTRPLGLSHFGNT